MTKNKHAVSLWAPNLVINNSKISGSTSTIYGDNIKVRSTGAIIADSNISAPAAGKGDIAIDANMNVTVVNSNYSTVSFGTGAKLYRKWWYQAHVNDTSGNNVVANVTAYNATGAMEFSMMTNSTGRTNITEITEYVQNSSGDKAYYSNYTISVYNDSHPPYYIVTENFSRNITSLRSLDDTLTKNYDSNAPVVKAISASDANYTYNVTDSSTILNCSLIISSTLRVNNSNINNTGGTETFLYTATKGTYPYSIECYDAAFNLGTASGSVTITETTPIISVSGGGAGGGGASTGATFELIVPLPITIYEAGKVEVPIIIKNTGDRSFKNIEIKAKAENKNVDLQIDKNSIDLLKVKASENVIITANVKSNDITTYGIKITAKSGTPTYDDDGVAYINVVGANASGVKKTVVFADDMIIGNPECLELKEMVTEADLALEQGNYQEAIEKSQEAVEACKEILTGPKRPSYPEIPSLLGDKNRIIWYVVIGSAAAIILGILINIARKIAFRRKKIKSEES